MPSTVSTKSQAVVVDPVTDLVITPRVPDGEGGYQRSLRVFGEADGPGSKPLVFEVILRGATEADLEVDLDRIKY